MATKWMAYSVKEKAQVEILEPKLVTMKNGRKAIQGVSAEGNKLYRIVGKEDAAKFEKEMG